MSAHTPGPWKASRRYADTIVIEGDGGYRHIVGVGADEITESGGEEMSAEQEANARLIAAAPELLAALERLTDVTQWLDVSFASEDEEAEAEEALGVAQAAIAKARGK